MIEFKPVEFTVISPVNDYRPIFTCKNPICNRKPYWALTLDDIETLYAKDYKEMKIKKKLRQVIEFFLGKRVEKYRSQIPLAINNLYNMEE